MRIQLSLALSLLAAVAPQAPPAAPASPVPATRLQTRWAAEVTPDRVLPEYPRPQLARRNWVNLNGRWHYAVADADAPRPSAFEGRILVPFPIESQLSGAGVWITPAQRLWYRRTFATPPLPTGHRLLLNFGAVDWEAVVYVNGTSAGVHRGGFAPGANAGFAYVPLTGAARAALRPGRNTIAVHAHQNRGGQFIDVGLVDVIEPGPPR